MKRFWLLLPLAALLCAAARGDDWPQFRGANRDGISRERGLLTKWPAQGPAKVWTQPVGAGGSSMAVADGKLYTLGNTNDTDTVFCFDAKTGKLIWQHSYPCAGRELNGFRGPRATPMVDGDRVYTLSLEGHLFCFNTRTGLPLWSAEYPRDFDGKPPPWGWWGMPVIDGDLLIAEVGSGRATPAVVAFDKRSGAVVWKSGFGGAAYASPVAYELNGERFALTFGAAGLESRRVKDGKLAWSFPWRTSFDMNAATPIVVGDRVFVSSAYRMGSALLDISGKKPVALWEQKQMAVHMNGAVYWGGHLYGFDESTLRCLDFQNGAIKWSVDKFRKGSLMIADGRLIILGGDGVLAVAEANPKAYRELASARVVEGKDLWTPPVLANGLIYARARDAVVCLDVRGGENTAAQWVALFPEDGAPKGWRVREWSDIRRPGPEGAKWEAVGGVLFGSDPRGTWLVSDREYGDFELEFEWKLPKGGNSGCGIRFPEYGDPSFDGLEVQMVDPRFFLPETKIPADELTGALYRGVAPTVQLFKPGAWNKFLIKAVGPNVSVNLNGERVLDVNLSDQTALRKRRTDEEADALKDRPRKGRIGFQELSLDGGRTQIRNARIRVLD
jgi:outer membrane protein assembly factor BamB